MELLPARAGMIPRSLWSANEAAPAPRTRGDDPEWSAEYVEHGLYSPHARG